jgi:hypothetical protein
MCILTQDAEIVEYDTEDTMPDLTRVSLFSVFLQFLADLLQQPMVN